MGYTICLAGKGGTGKTTIAGLLVRMLKERKVNSILAIDADPNNNLGEVLGIKVPETIGTILDEVASRPQDIPAGMTKDRFIEYKVQSAVYEAEGFDLLTMGKPEGPGCYCYVNNVLRNVMSRLIKDYKYVIIDNEAGLEHLSRRTTRQADTLLVISDATPVGLKAAGRINELAQELKIDIRNRLLLVNRFERGLEKEKIKSTGLDLIGQLPVDEQLAEISLNGNSVLELNNDAPLLVKLRTLGDKLWQS
ncbi:MAG: AAA family ATPase [Candidatus Omnitrophica bacterium]|nr:AAA family ATPase [Candidatus Omnitrophota bacterium]